MKIYLAARYDRKDELTKYAQNLSALGIQCTSRWLYEEGAEAVGMSDHHNRNREVAIVDIEDVDAADAIVFFAEDPLVGTPRGGRHVEFGYALAKNKGMFVVGPMENIFHYLPVMNHYPNWDTLLYRLEQWKKEQDNWNRG